MHRKREEIKIVHETKMREKEREREIQKMRV